MFKALTFTTIGVRLGDFACLTIVDIISLCLEFSKKSIGLPYILNLLTSSDEVQRTRSDIILNGPSYASLEKIMSTINTIFSNYARLVGLSSFCLNA